jgi:hypothetical protein
MGAAPVVRVEGARELRRTLKAAGNDLEDLKKVNATIARYVALRAAAMAPRRSGRLAGSVRGNQAKTMAAVRAGGARVPYANVIHWGWPRHHIASQPFLVDAAHITEPTWTRYYLREVERILSHVHGT